MNHVHGRNNQPAQFLVDNVDLLPRGRVLDLAMGSGRNAVYLAGKGFDVEGVDRSPDAVEEAMSSARSAGVSLDARVMDLEKASSIKTGYYDVIICFNYLQRSLIPSIIEGLKPGGMVVYETFIIDQRRFGRPNSPEFLLEHNELLEVFRSLRCLRYREGIIDNNRAVAGIVAQKQ